MLNSYNFLLKIGELGMGSIGEYIPNISQAWHIIIGKVKGIIISYITIGRMGMKDLKKI